MTKRTTYTDTDIRAKVNRAKRDIREACSPCKPKFHGWSIDVPKGNGGSYAILTIHYSSSDWTEPTAGTETYNVAL